MVKKPPEDCLADGRNLIGRFGVSDNVRPRLLQNCFGRFLQMSLLLGFSVSTQSALCKGSLTAESVRLANESVFPIEIE